MQNYNSTITDHNINIEAFQIRQELINKLAVRFSTYGYKQINTPTFSPYDLYANMNGTVNHNEMIKTIDNTGQVLVLRPDITIPITQQIASKNKQLAEEARYFYILDVFRQQVGQSGNRENTQAGVECFGNGSPEVDAEIIALAIHALKDLNISHFKIEVGHAGFFKQLVKELQLRSQDLKELKQLIQAKNIPEIAPFLNRLSVSNQLNRAVQEIPLLYGEAKQVIERAQWICCNHEMKEKLQDLTKMYDILEDYGVADHLVIDLGLINHMDYYSGIIFQGFIENVGKPVLMGGRYDHLADQFDATIPAIGFACDINGLLTGTAQQQKTPLLQNDFTIIYEKTKQKEALKIANYLRSKNLRVLSFPTNQQTTDRKKSAYTIVVDEKDQKVTKKNYSYSFQNIKELMEIVKEDFN